MKKLYIFLILFVGALAFQSCDESITPNADRIAAIQLLNARKQLLVDKTWKFYLFITINPDGTQSTNYSVKDGIGTNTTYAQITYVFKSDGTLVLNAASSSITGKWEFSSDGTAIITQLGLGAQVIYSIQTLTATELEMESSSSKQKLVL